MEGNGSKTPTELLPGLVNDRLMHYFDLAIMGVGCASISLLGIFTNAVNIVVFVRQGLKDSVTITLLSLSVTDLGGNVFGVILGLSSIAKETGFLVQRVDWSAFSFVCCIWYRAVCHDTSSLTTVYISVERCLSVVMPFKIKGLFTPSRATKILIVIYVVIFSCFLPVFVSQGLSWQPTGVGNSTWLTVWLSSDRPRIEAVLNYMNGITFATVNHIIVIVCTYQLIRGLFSSAEFRSRSTIRMETRPGKDGDFDNNDISTMESRPKLSKKDRKVVKLVVLVAVVFIACTLPQVLMVWGRRLIPDLNIGRRYENLHWTFFGITYFLGGVNASVNMFIYLHASSKYRAVFLETFCTSGKS